MRSPVYDRCGKHVKLDLPLFIPVQQIAICSLNKVLDFSVVDLFLRMSEPKISPGLDFYKMKTSGRFSNDFNFITSIPPVLLENLIPE
jgi:hypothetical protein